MKITKENLRTMLREATDDHDADSTFIFRPKSDDTYDPLSMPYMTDVNPQAPVEKPIEKESDDVRLIRLSGIDRDAQPAHGELDLLLSPGFNIIQDEGGIKLKSIMDEAIVEFKRQLGNVYDRFADPGKPRSKEPVALDIKPFLEILRKSSELGKERAILSDLIRNMRWAFNAAAIRLVPPQSHAREDVEYTVESLIHTPPVKFFYRSQDYNDYFRNLQRLWRIVRGTGMKIGESKMKITKTQLRRMMRESLIITDEPESELSQFASSKSGRGCAKAGAKVSSAASSLRDLGDNQTGKMRIALYGLSEFVGKIGNTLSSLNELDEGEESSGSKLPTVGELKRIQKLIKELEKIK